MKNMGSDDRKIKNSSNTSFSPYIQKMVSETDILRKNHFPYHFIRKQSIAVVYGESCYDNFMKGLMNIILT